MALLEEGDSRKLAIRLYDNIDGLLLLKIIPFLEGFVINFAKPIMEKNPEREYN